MYSICVHLKQGESRNFSLLFDEITEQLGSKDFELVITTGIDSYVDIKKLKTIFDTAGVSFTVAGENIDSVGLAYECAHNQSTGDSLIFLDPNDSIPLGFFTTMSAYTEEEVVVIPRPWRVLYDSDAGYWEAPTYRTMAIPRHLYGRGSAKWQYRDSSDLLDLYLGALAFAKEHKVLVSKYPGMQKRLMLSCTSVVDKEKLMLDPLQDGLHEDDIRSIAWGRPLSGRGKLLPSQDYSFTTEEGKNLTASVIEREAKIVGDNIAHPGEMSSFDPRLYSRLWKLFWEGKIPIVPELYINRTGSGVSINSTGRAILPFTTKEEEDV